MTNSHQVSPTLHIPLRAVLTSMAITFLVSLLNVGSTTALNAFSALYVVANLSSYAITLIYIVLKRLRGEPLPPRRWSLGKYGLTINILALIFLIPMWIFAFWPVATPVQPDSMNYSVVMYVGVMALALIYYLLHGRHVYTGPVVIVKRDL